MWLSYRCKLKGEILQYFRVSTTGQVDHADIPMQKKACLEYASTHPDWEIVKIIPKKVFRGTTDLKWWCCPVLIFVAKLMSD